MKEYKTLKIDPSEEDKTITKMARFGWKVEDSREVYNESQRIVGIEGGTTHRSYGNGFAGGFMRGFTGNDGTSNTQMNILTDTDVTHFLSLRFSRDTTMKNYDRIKKLEEEYNNSRPQFKNSVSERKKPTGLTVVAVIAIIISLIILISNRSSLEPAGIVIFIVIPIIAILVIVFAWSRYNKYHPIEVSKNKEIKKFNEDAINSYRKRMQEIEKEAVTLLEEKENL